MCLFLWPASTQPLAAAHACTQMPGPVGSCFPLHAQTGYLLLSTVHMKGRNPAGMSPTSGSQQCLLSCLFAGAKYRQKQQTTAVRLAASGRCAAQPAWQPTSDLRVRLCQGWLDPDLSTSCNCEVLLVSWLVPPAVIPECAELSPRGL